MNINPRTQDAYDLLHKGVLALAKAEQAGIRVDTVYVERKKRQLTKRIEVLEEEFKQTKFYAHWEHTVRGKINIYSGTQLAYFLYDIKKIKVERETASGQGSTDDEALKQMNIPELNVLLEMKKLKKVRDTYLDAFYREQVDGYIHPFFNLHMVQTFRSSSDRPNFQNIPRRDEESMQICRRALFPRPGHILLEADLSSTEVKVAACVTDDTQLETIDGSQTIKKVIERIQNKEEVYIYGYNETQKRIGVSKVTDGGITRKQTEVWAVMLDNDQIIKATLDHHFMLRNGTYLPLQELQVNDSLMPFYKKDRKSNYGITYEYVYLNNGQTISAHKLIAQDVLNSIVDKKSNKVVHHENKEGRDNSLSNIKIITRNEHTRLHSIQGWLNRPASARNLQGWSKGLTKDTDPRVAKISKSRKGQPAHNKGQTGIFHTSEITKQRIREKLLGRTFTEEAIEKQSQSRYKYWENIKKNEEKTECKICGKFFTTLTNTHLKYKHNIFIKEYKETYNHKVKSIEFYGYEDVYNINVEEFHNYALSAGVIVKNCYHKDPTMIKYMKDPKSDMHADMAKQIFIIDKFNKSIPEHYLLRQAAKNGFVFPEFYGDYYKNCAVGLACIWGKLPQGKWTRGQGVPLDTEQFTLGDHLIAKGITSFDSFTEHIKKIEADFWGKRFADYADWKDRWWNVYKKYGYVDLLTGFRCSGVMDRKQTINYPVQGAAFHCLLWAFTRLTDIMTAEHWDSKLIGQIHDSMIWDIAPDELTDVVKTIKRVVCEELPAAWNWIIVPMDIDFEASAVDESWAQKTKLKI
jgi:hypothetical protein